MEELKKIKIKNKIWEALNLLIRIQKLYDRLGISYGKEENLLNIINPFYNQIEECSCLIIEDYYGIPSKIYTPLGYMNITYSYTCLNGCNTNTLEDLLEKEIGLEFYKPKLVSAYGEVGGWRKTKDDIALPRERINFIEYREAKEIYKEFLNEEKIIKITRKE